MPSTAPAPPVTATSPRPVLEAELRKVNDIARRLPACPAWDVAHDRINQLLDWLIGR